MDNTIKQALEDLKAAVDESVKAAYYVAQMSYDGSDVEPGIRAAEDVARKMEEVMRLLGA